MNEARKRRNYESECSFCAIRHKRESQTGGEPRDGETCLPVVVETTMQVKARVKKLKICLERKPSASMREWPQNNLAYNETY